MGAVQAVGGPPDLQKGGDRSPSAGSAVHQMGILKGLLPTGRGLPL